MGQLIDGATSLLELLGVFTLEMVLFVDAPGVVAALTEQGVQRVAVWTGVACAGGDGPVLAQGRDLIYYVAAFGNPGQIERIAIASAEGRGGG